MSDEIRPDWEQKLNAVKAAAARRASRRIVMRQVGARSGIADARLGTGSYPSASPRREHRGQQTLACPSPKRRDPVAGAALASVTSKR
jgi:hypothetical protein